MSSLLRATVLCALLATCGAAQTPPADEEEIYDVQGFLLRPLRIAEEEIYDVGDLLLNSESRDPILDPDQLETIVTNSVGEDNWDDPASIEIREGKLIVNQTRELHGQIRAVLEQLRRDARWSVRLETWWVELSDDFLRDVGVEFRDVDVRFGFTFDGALRSPPRMKEGRIDLSRRGGDGQAPLFGSSLFSGTRTVLDECNTFFGGVRLNSAGVVSAGGPNRGRALLAVLLEPFQRSAIFGDDQELARHTLVQGPVITATNRQRVHASVVTQRPYITDYELAAGLANPILETFEEGLVLDVRPTVSRERTYVTLDVRSTLSMIVSGRAASDLSVEVPQLSAHTACTSVRLPDGGTVLLGGLRQGTSTNLIVLVIAKLVSRQAD